MNNNSIPQQYPGIPDQAWLSVSKPSQYLGGELNSITKSDREVLLHFALCFPDVYEVGMSHLGLQILYEILNNRPDIWAERAFMPFPDFEAVLRSHRSPLCSLEAKRPLHAFDIIGFSLQYELCGTNILAMLDLGGIPLLAEERQESAPLIIGGGPFSYHPEPLAPFFDAFFIGDAEEAILEIAEAVKSARKAAQLKRKETLAMLGEISGVYLPSLARREGTLSANGGPVKRVTRRLLPTLENVPSIVKPVVPNVRTVHNRLSIEVMRGCVRGCRFCQAGYLYRPQRERSPEEILQRIETALPATGFDELSLLSLSTADYCSIVPLLKSVMDRFADGDKISVSFPSTRVDALTPEILSQVQRVRRTSFTVAPEAGTQRLRDVINKGVSDEEILKTAANVFEMGWTGIKLYFMIGLPTETDNDLQGIIDLARRIKQLPSARGRSITISVSTHVPKPHTPFQWAEQISPDETIQRQEILKRGLRTLGVNFRYHDPFSSFLEGVFARGGRELAQVLLRAFALGSRLEAWSEHLKPDLWAQAFTDTGVQPLFYLRERAAAEALPWDHLDCGIPKEYFRREYERALRARETADCLTTSCSVCGVCNYDTVRNVLFPRAEAEARFAQTTQMKIPVPCEVRSRVRIRYQKTGTFRFLGHLELSLLFQRAVRRAELPVALSRGFHPFPRIAFGPPLAVGITSSCEFVDIFLLERFDPESLVTRLNGTLPPELAVLEVSEVPIGEPSIQASLSAQLYHASYHTPPEGLICRFLTPSALSGTWQHVPQDAFAAMAVELDPSLQNDGPRNRGKQRLLGPVGAYLRSIAVLTDDQSFALECTLRSNPQKSSAKVADLLYTLTGVKYGSYRLEKVSAEFGRNHPEPARERPFSAVSIVENSEADGR